MNNEAPVKIAILGLGHWGPNYLRVFNAMDESEVAWCCDLKPEHLGKVKYLPFVRLTQQYEEILADPAVRAVVVATPSSTHYRVVRACLEAGKDVLSEKPLTLEPEEALELCRLAEKNDLILMVGHTFLYNPGIRKIKQYIDEAVLGQIYYLNATRTHLGLIREDINAIWDLAPHDISIFNYFLGTTPLQVNAIGACHLKAGKEDVAFINLIYPNSVIANIHVSWEDSNKERTIRVVGSEARSVFNDLDNFERVRLFKKGIGVTQETDDYGDFQLQLRDGDIISPLLELHEPLKEMCAHFIRCVRERSRPLTDGRSGYEVVKVMKAIETEIHKNHAVHTDTEKVRAV